MGDEMKVLDACCGSRMAWFQPVSAETYTEFLDCRELEDTLCDGRTLSIKPTRVGDFRDLPYEDDSFHLVLFDPPHLVNCSDSSYMAKKYGKLNKDTWRDDLAKGFSECFRVLKPNGTLVFKWSEHDILLKQILELSPYRPLFGHTTNNKRTCH